MPKIVQMPNGDVVEFPESMSDDQVGAAIRQQYEPKSGSFLASAGSAVGNALVGAAKGAGSTAFGLGSLVNSASKGLQSPLYPQTGVGDMIQPGSFDSKPPELTPQGTAQKVGYGAEQIGEYFIPGGAASKAGKLPLLGRMGMEALTTGAVGAAQSGGDPGQTAMAAATGAAGPPIGAVVAKGAPLLRKMAETQYGRALAATTKPLKAEAQKIVPQLLDRRVRGTLESLAAKGEANSGAIGEQIGKTYEGAAQAGKQTLTDPILSSLEGMKKKYFVQAGGKALNVNPAAVEKIEAVQNLVQQFGDAAEPDQLWKLRKNMDDIIFNGGQVSPGTMKALQAQTRTVVQNELSKVSPDLTKLNAEFSLWKGLQKVATATTNRKIGQSGIVEMGLRTSIGGAAGMLLGGDDPKWGAVGGMLGALTKHPLYRTVSAVEKARLASAMSEGGAEMAMSVLTRIAAALETGASGRSSDQQPTSTP